MIKSVPPLTAAPAQVDCGHQRLRNLALLQVESRNLYVLVRTVSWSMGSEGAAGRSLLPRRQECVECFPSTDPLSNFSC